LVSKVLGERKLRRAIMEQKILIKTMNRALFNINQTSTVRSGN
jgi:hypothetical protein